MKVQIDFLKKRCYELASASKEGGSNSEKNVWKYDLVNLGNPATLTPQGAYLLSEIRRGVDGNFYMPVLGETVEYMRNYDGNVNNTTGQNTSAYPNDQHKWSSSLPTQVFKIYAQANISETFTRKGCGRPLCADGAGIL